MPTSQRYYSPLDRLCMGLDQVIHGMTGHAVTTGRTNPAVGESEVELNEEKRKHAAGLMRVNHAGEVCAQALYHGQSVVSRNPLIQNHLQRAAIEEGDHLAWCGGRLVELGSHTSYLNPFWYAGSFLIGITAGLIGDKWSLGFVAETETQVMAHLEKHLHLLPIEDIKSIKILRQMQKDESKHHDEAIQSGAAELPYLIKKTMTLASKIMVKLAYWV